MGWKSARPKGEQADGPGGDNYHRHLKVGKRRRERRRSKHNPECQPTYKGYRGYEL